jgi:hypothetical protein
MSDFLVEIKEFGNYIPTAVGSDLDELEPYILQAEHWMKEEVLGETLYNKVVTLPEDRVILTKARLAVCHYAYLMAIPESDLIQTTNGFAVVSNSSQAPASKERVDRLLHSQKKHLTYALDWVLIQAISKAYREDWFECEDVADWYSDLIFMTTKELCIYSGNKTATYFDWLEARSIILSTHDAISRFISFDYFGELIRKRKEGNLTADDKKVLRWVQTVAGLMMQKLDYYPIVETMLNYMEQRKDTFTTYINSVEYKIKTSPKYENKKKDPTFFFG